MNSPAPIESAPANASAMPAAMTGPESLALKPATPLTTPSGTISPSNEPKTSWRMRLKRSIRVRSAKSCEPSWSASGRRTAGRGSSLAGFITNIVGLLAELLRDVLELGAELFGCLADNRRQAGQTLWILEILVAQSDHIPPRDLVLLRRGVNQAHARATCRWIEHLSEGHWTEAAVDQGDHRVAAAIQQVLGGAVAQIARVLHVKWDRISAAQLVANVFGHQRHGQPKSCQPIAQPVFDHVGQVYFGQPHMVVLVSLQLAKGLQVSGTQLLDETLGQDRRPVIVAHALASHNCAG